MKCARVSLRGRPHGSTRPDHPPLPAHTGALCLDPGGRRRSLRDRLRRRRASPCGRRFRLHARRGPAVGPRPPAQPVQPLLGRGPHHRADRARAGRRRDGDRRRRRWPGGGPDRRRRQAVANPAAGCGDCGVRPRARVRRLARIQRRGLRGPDRARRVGGAARPARSGARRHHAGAGRRDLVHLVSRDRAHRRRRCAHVPGAGEPGRRNRRGPGPRAVVQRGLARGPPVPGRRATALPVAGWPAAAPAAKPAALPCRAGRSRSRAAPTAPQCGRRCAGGTVRTGSRG